MNRKAIIAMGTALAGAGIVLATQGAAQAGTAAPVVVSQKTTAVDSEKQPAIIRSAVARAAVHARAAISSSAVNNAIEHASVIASLGSAPKDGPGAQAGSAEGIFDK